jgi:hypothetical protein
VWPIRPSRIKSKVSLSHPLNQGDWYIHINCLCVGLPLPPKRKPSSLSSLKSQVQAPLEATPTPKPKAQNVSNTPPVANAFPEVTMPTMPTTVLKSYEVPGVRSTRDDISASRLGGGSLPQDPSLWSCPDCLPVDNSAVPIYNPDRTSSSSSSSVQRHRSQL